MRIDSKTMLFQDLSEEEAIDLQKVCEYLVLKGEIDGNTRHWFELWRVGCGFTEDQLILTMSTAFPQRALLSLIFRKTGRVTQT